MKRIKKLPIVGLSFLVISNVAILESESTIMTPLSLLMRLYLAILSDSPKEILFLLDKIMKDAPFLDFQQRHK